MASLNRVSQGFALLEGLRTVQGLAEQRRIVEAATTPLVRAAAALHPGAASAGGAEGGLDSARLLRLMLQHLMAELNGSYNDEGLQVSVCCV